MKFECLTPKRAWPLLAVTAFVALAVPRRALPQAPSQTDHTVNQMLRPGDEVRLRVWREPDLSGTYPLDENGMAVFPKIGPVPVGRLTTDSVKSLLVSTYSRYLQDPAVEVTFLRRINVLGWVKNPGLYHVDPTMTLADALAMAGGVSPDGNSKKVELYREGERVATQLPLQALLTDLPLQSGDQLRVPERSWLSRNSAAVIGASISAAGLIAAALIRF